MGPFMVFFFGMGLVTLPEAARILRRSPRHLPLFCMLVSAGLALAGLLWGIVLLVVMPRGLGHLTARSPVAATYPLVLPSTIGIMGGCVQAGGWVRRARLGVAKRSLRAMILFSALYVACSLGGAAADGVMGTVIGAAIASWIGGLLFWWQFPRPCGTGPSLPTAQVDSSASRQGPASAMALPSPRSGEEDQEGARVDHWRRGGGPLPPLVGVTSTATPRHSPQSDDDSKLAGYPHPVCRYMPLPGKVPLPLS